MSSPSFSRSPSRGGAMSSPDLPAIEDMISQIPTHRRAIRSGSKAKPIPIGVSTTFTSAKDHLNTVQSVPDDSNELDSIIEISPAPAPKQRKSRRPKESNEESIVTDVLKGASKAKKPRRKGTAGNGTAAVIPHNEDTRVDKIAKASTAPTFLGGSVAPEPVSGNTEATKDELQDHKMLQTEEAITTASNNVGHLEYAPMRRVDWTPPPETDKSLVDLTSDGPVTQEAESTQGSNERVVFKNLLRDYGCSEQPIRDGPAEPGEDASFFKKRKLIELVQTGDVSRSASPDTEKSPTKQKPAKRKPRTITELATAAYRPATQTEDKMAVMSAAGPSNANNALCNLGQSTGKALGKKKPTRKSRKKPSPARPVLLSPGAALGEVSKQQFVFGTSSQLVREHSPSLLRDIQTAIKDSNQVGWDPYSNPWDSEGVETPEERKRLWEAGARDVDGLLFDAELVDVDATREDLPVEDSADPFGYVKPEISKQPTLGEAPDPHMDSFETLSDILPPPRPSQKAKDDDRDIRSSGMPATTLQDSDQSFETLSDILPPPKLNRQTPDLVDEDVSLPSSEVSVSTNIGQPPSGENDPAKALIAPPTRKDVPKAVPEAPTRPKYDLYTDAQLSAEITSFGFKAVKRRTAMISLLDQCWQSKHPAAQTSTRTLSTSCNRPAVTPSQSTDPPASPKRPRGRPRKASVSSSQAQEPPPSAQPPASPGESTGRRRRTNSPKRSPSPGLPPAAPPSAQPDRVSTKRRGRPKKDTNTAPKASRTKPSTTKTKKDEAPTLPPPPSTPNRKRSSKTVVEIPDSASENDEGILTSPSSSIDPTFSPQAGVDLSVSMEEDSELTLPVAPDDSEGALLDQITKAITSAPRTTDPSKPSWYEKILLYDPIILEDLTAWLNTGPLTKVGYDGEVYPGLVKKWCESKSVCCLWRVNLRGKERKRY